jgi:drug/metabolite transporter (DMT)-like permease
LDLTSIRIYQARLHLGISCATASNSSLLAGTSPVWTAIIVAASGQVKITGLQVPGVLLWFAGLAVVVAARISAVVFTGRSFQGDVLMVLAAVTSAPWCVVAVKLLERYSAPGS